MRRRLYWAARLACALSLCALAAARAEEMPAPPTTASDAPAPAADASATAADAPASDIGRSIFVANEVDGQAGDAPPKHIAVNDDIVFEEDITTGSDAKAVLEFRDGSTFEVGPNAMVRIDSFIFNPAESTSHKSLQVTRGVFRYVSAYVSSDQNTTIKTPGGNMGIRGSVAAGIVDPGVPDFVFLGEGEATFTNSAGSSTLQPGNSIAVPSATTPPMQPSAMPAAVAAQAMQAITARLPPPNATANRPPPDEAWLQRAGRADLVPVSEQQRLAAARAGNARPLPQAAGPGPGNIAGEVGLLVEANRANLFNGRPAARTPEQTAFLARAARENPNAGAMLRRYTENARAMHAAHVTAGTEYVIRGVGHAAPSVDVMRRVTAASTHANPGAAALINRHATEAYRGPDRGELNRPGRPGNERPGNERPSGERFGGERPGGERPGARPVEGRPNGERPGGERFGGQRPGGERFNGVRRPGEARPGDQRPAVRQQPIEQRPAARPEQQRPGARAPNESDRRQPPGNARQPGRQPPPPQRPAPQQQQKPPPKEQNKKNNERDNNQQQR